MAHDAKAKAKETLECERKCISREDDIAEEKVFIDSLGREIIYSEADAVEYEKCSKTSKGA